MKFIRRFLREVQMAKKTYEEICVEVQPLCVTDVLRTSSDNMDGFDDENWG